MSSKATSFCLIVFLFFFFFFTLSNFAIAARQEPASSLLQDTNIPSTQTDQHQLGVEAEKVDQMEDSCEGIEEEACLMRRTLAAHVDYIYTQNTKP